MDNIEISLQPNIEILDFEVMKDRIVFIAKTSSWMPKALVNNVFIMVFFLQLQNKHSQEIL